MSKLEGGSAETISRHANEPRIERRDGGSLGIFGSMSCCAMVYELDARLNDGSAAKLRGHHRDLISG